MLATISKKIQLLLALLLLNGCSHAETKPIYSMDALLNMTPEELSRLPVKNNSNR